MAVASVSAAVIGLLALYLAHGFSPQTGVAVLGTFASLALTGLLAALFVAATHLTGLSDENALVLDATNGGISMRGIIVAGIVIGSLGVLDDVTVTSPRSPPSGSWCARNPACAPNRCSRPRCGSGAITSLRP